MAAPVGSVGTRLASRLKTKLYDTYTNAGAYLKQVLKDYKNSTVDIFVDARAKPLKAAFYISSLSAIIYCAKHNPNEDSFHNAIISASNDLLQLGYVVRNPISNRYVQKLVDLRNNGQLRRMNLGVCSVMWEDNYSEELGIYHAVCKHLKVTWKEFPDRILDVGFLDKWYILEKKMIDFDVNPEEWEGVS